ncbi:unnamed protein product [Acanthoscelides obtectus]|uniref:Uncharacterized protein n=1 Tax=Acanthoscelides obtectus TaxID=200917 RepID=A0A9P0KRM9_ACAOB|nr:unnamed protein product [Acanthoscelides obtectus]CAK1625170.1 hypothetical protein AOBTE_LOCUS3003 [Acanthoscelides obtectus]
MTGDKYFLYMVVIDLEYSVRVATNTNISIFTLLHIILLDFLGFHILLNCSRSPGLGTALFLKMVINTDPEQANRAKLNGELTMAVVSCGSDYQDQHLMHSQSS